MVKIILISFFLWIVPAKGAFISCYTCLEGFDNLLKYHRSSYQGDTNFPNNLLDIPTCSNSYGGGYSSQSYSSQGRDSYSSQGRDSYSSRGSQSYDSYGQKSNTVDKDSNTFSCAVLNINGVVNVNDTLPIRLDAVVRHYIPRGQCEYTKQKVRNYLSDEFRSSRSSSYSSSYTSSSSSYNDRESGSVQVSCYECSDHECNWSGGGGGRGGYRDYWSAGYAAQASILVFLASAAVIGLHFAR